jgi:hypothetical protein
MGLYHTQKTLNKPRRMGTKQRGDCEAELRNANTALLDVNKWRRALLPQSANGHVRGFSNCGLRPTLKRSPGPIELRNCGASVMQHGVKQVPWRMYLPLSV